MYDPKQLFRVSWYSPLSFAFTLGVPVDILKHSSQDPADTRLSCGTVNFGSRLGGTPVGFDELLIKRAEIDLFFLLRHRLVLGDSGTDIVLNANAQNPAMGLLPGSHLENANFASLAQSLFFAII
jgi:hypothetical protein